jgi:glutamate/tyrosine decarboxylase-like PLP-dependent enzyme
VSDFETQPADILERLRELREADAPTHGGHVLSYVYDSGMAELDELAAAAVRMVQPVNGLDPTTFTSVAVLEREVLGFVRGILHGGSDVVGSVTTGGTESCLLAVKTARDNWRLDGGTGQPRLLAPVTVHAAFQKAAHYFGLVLDLVPVDQGTGAVSADALVDRFSADVALVVVSAPSYPFAGLDPVADVAAAALAAGIDCHVDACIGGLVLPFLTDLPAWDFAVEGVTSISADLHKFGYSPKGASVLLQRGRDRQRTQYFATTRWPGYPVVNPTILGSKSAGSLAASWAIIHALGVEGFTRLAASCEYSTRALLAIIGGIEGLRIVGSPVGPLIAVTTDESVPVEKRVDPHHWADQARTHGWLLQLQPSIAQDDGTVLPRTTHLTITPVTEGVLPELTAVLVASAEEVRGVAPVTPADVLGTLPPLGDGVLDSETSFTLLAAMGLGGGGGLPDRMAPLLAIMEGLPAPVAERLLTELLARLVEPLALE